jgi:hypothetical protein
MSYEWAIKCLWELLKKIGISAPILIVTDREIALMKALDGVFLGLVHLLCTLQIAESTFPRANLRRRRQKVSDHFLELLYN